MRHASQYLSQAMAPRMNSSVCLSWMSVYSKRSNAAQHAISLLTPLLLHSICIFSPFAFMDLYVSATSSCFVCAFQFPSVPKIFVDVGEMNEFLDAVLSAFVQCSYCSSEPRHVIWPNTWLADLRHCSLHCRWQTVQAAGAIRRAWHVLRPIWGAQWALCICVLCPIYNCNAMPGGKVRR